MDKERRGAPVEVKVDHANIMLFRQSNTQKTSRFIVGSDGVRTYYRVVIT